MPEEHGSRSEKGSTGPSFATTIQPYFTPLDHTQMLSAAHTGGFTIDLWSASVCQTNFNLILKVISQGRMPPAGAGSDGPWSQTKINQFVSDFNAWKAGGFQP
jgi:hypothetical protein